MGYKLDTCSCYKTTEDTAIEVELKSGEKQKIQILTQASKFAIKKVISNKNSSFSSKLSNIKNDTNSDSIFIEKNDLKPLINNINLPEVIIQSIFRGFIYRKKFIGINGLKQELINENKEIINKIEKDFIANSIIKSEKLYINENFEENWKKYYEDINDLIPKNNNINKKNYLVYTKCLLTKYKGKNSLYKGKIYINSIIVNRNKNSLTSNINNLTGKGILYLKNGKKYEGNFLNGDLNGWCRFINSNGVCYEGLFISGILNGKGEIIKIDENRRKNIYRGDIKNFKKEGKGEEKTSDYTYEGDFFNDLKNGKGKISYSNNGDYYDGEFKNGAITGKGFYQWKNKHTYFGDFVGGKMHGKGKYKWPDGNEYEGEYIYNIKEGDGIFKWKDGRIYKGKFKNGKPHGKGILTVNGVNLNAIFEDGKYVGEFQMTISSKESSL
jgi:hypothetical protein